jgi:hypothetical protein
MHHQLRQIYEEAQQVIDALLTAALLASDECYIAAQDKATALIYRGQPFVPRPLQKHLLYAKRKESIKKHLRLQLEQSEARDDDSKAKETPTKCSYSPFEPPMQNSPDLEQLGLNVFEISSRDPEQGGGDQKQAAKRPRSPDADPYVVTLILVLTCDCNNNLGFTYTISANELVNATYNDGRVVVAQVADTETVITHFKLAPDFVRLQVETDAQIPPNLRLRIYDAWNAVKQSNKRAGYIAEFFADPVKFEHTRITLYNDGLLNKGNECWRNSLFQLLASAPPIVTRVEETALETTDPL